METAYLPQEGQATAHRSTFIIKTYWHLIGAIFAFVGIEYALFQSGVAFKIASVLLGGSWLLVLGGFMVVSFLASKFAHQGYSRPLQYAALGAMVLAQAIIFVPLLFIAESKAPGTVATAGQITIAGFTALSAIVFVTRKNFSFLRPALMWGGLLAIGLIVAATLFGFQLGMLFSAVMVGYAGAAILYTTSAVLHDFDDEGYVGASLELFSSVALLLWYVIQLVMAFGDD